MTRRKIIHTTTKKKKAIFHANFIYSETMLSIPGLALCFIQQVFYWN